MKSFSFSIFNVVSIFAIIILIVLIIIPFNLINLEQAQRIAKWKSTYEEIKYSFDLVKLHENPIIPNDDEYEKSVNNEYIKNRIFPYFNMLNYEKINLKKYTYRKLNGSPIKKNWQYYFNEFYELKDGTLISIKNNENEKLLPDQPLYFMLIDINGAEKPNRIGQDIFFINIYSDKITPLGEGKGYERLKVNCSPIGSGLYCSEYYLLGGNL